MVLESHFRGPNSLQPVIESGLEQLARQNAAQRIWNGDASFWKSEAQAQAAIRERLGWLTVANLMQQKRDEISGFVNGVRQAGYQSAVLLGMGGSSLCPEVLRLTFGHTPGYLKLFVLDTTDPDTILSVERQIDLNTTLFIVASKSGKTLETLSQFKYFYDKVSHLVGTNAGERFIAITDPGTPLEQLARDHHFRHIFSNPPDIGGRYSALSYFGLVPGALIGVDIEKLLSRAQEMMQKCGADHPAQDNPGLWLGAALGTLATQQGRNKITFALSPGIASFGLWVEQLIAESTGKEGRGLVPVASEQLGRPQDYDNDRVFVYLRLYGSQNSQLNDAIETLVAAGQPEISYDLRDDYDLGAQFFLWEFAVATAGHILNINPFNEPNVQESKENTNNILAQYEKQGKLPQPPPVIQQGNITIYGPENGARSLTDYLHAFLGKVQPGDYIAIMAYVQQNPETEGALEALRIRLRNLYKVATTVGYGPRFLHSTGQLHKGGANNGVFIQITGQDRHDMAIPGEPYTFGILKAAQALGDFYSLEHHQRRVISIHIADSLGQGLHVIEQAVSWKGHKQD
jgi:transaldolase/glucose-6-phosphate isomerase